MTPLWVPILSRAASGTRTRRRRNPPRLWDASRTSISWASGVGLCLLSRTLPEPLQVQVQVATFNSHESPNVHSSPL